MTREHTPIIPPQRSLTITVVCLLGFLLCMGLIFCGCAQTTTGKALNVGVVGAKVLDQVSTDRAEARGAREANRLLGDHQWRQVLIGSVGGECGDRGHDAAGEPGPAGDGAGAARGDDRRLQCGGCF